jgi:protein ImuB
MFAAVFVPDLPLQAILRLEPALAGSALAVVEANTLLHLTSAARDASLQEGMTVMQALGRHPNLEIKSRSLLQEASAREALLSIAYGWSALIEDTGLGICTADLRHISRDYPADARQVIARLESLHLRATIGIAANPDLALLAARVAAPIRVVHDPRAFLDPLPIAMLDPSPESAAILFSWGLSTIGQLASIPLDALTERLGPDAVELWHKANGSHTRLLRLVEPPALFAEGIEFENPLELMQPLLFSSRRLLDQLCAKLQAVYLATREFTITLYFDDQTKYTHTFHIPEPTNASDVLFRMVETHIEPLRAAAPIVGLNFSASPAPPSPCQLDLFQSGLRNPNRFFDTLAQLFALAGADRVGQPQTIDTHRPDAFTMNMPQFGTAPKNPGPALPHTGLALRRVRPPCPIHVQGAATPEAVTLDRQAFPVIATAGPWLSSGNWWDKDHWARMEWDLQLSDGRLIRVSKTESAEWLLDGYYD